LRTSNNEFPLAGKGFSGIHRDSFANNPLTRPACAYLHLGRQRHPPPPPSEVQSLWVIVLLASGEG